MMDIIKELKKLRMGHYVCDDCWYSCPLSGECCDENKDKECDCGADRRNKILDGIIAHLQGGK